MKFLMLSSTVVILLLLLISGQGLGIASVAEQCLQDQKELLLELRNNLVYNSSLSTKLVQWDESIDCCRWGGVKCDTKGRVSGLDLSGDSISGGISDAGSSLVKLLFLQSLNLAQNSFGSVEFPSLLGGLTELRYLNLSNSGFSGQIHLVISNLTRLVVLDLSSSPYSSVTLEHLNLVGLIQKLNELQELYLDLSNVSAKGPDWCHALSSYTPNLRVLSMPYTYLTGPLDSSLLKLQSLSIIRLDGTTFSTPFPEFLADFPKLQVLTMSNCNLSGVVPRKLFQIKSLERIDLNNNENLEGSLPEFPLDGSLQTLELQSTKFSGNLPESIGRLRMLLNLDLRFSTFSGSIPGSIKNLTQLQFLYLSNNQFFGSIPSFAFVKDLTKIELGGNRLTGQIPDSNWKGLENLEHLNLGRNSLEGGVPASLFALPSLRSLDLSNNSFSGWIQDSKTASSSPLEVIDLSYNNIEGPIPKFLFELQNLSSLSLPANKFSGSIVLTDFKKQTRLEWLDLSYNNISIRTSENVSIFSVFPGLTYLFMRSCKLQRVPLPNNPSSLILRLDLSDNQIEGEIPNWIFSAANISLAMLDLSHNHFTSLQDHFDLHSTYLGYLNLGSNMLGGQIPIPPSSIRYLDLSNNNYSSSIPANYGNYIANTIFTSMANNRIIGTIPPSLCNATNLQILNLSNNSLQGRIPSCLSFKTVGVLNLRRNNLGGNIPNAFPVGCSLRTLDLSQNFLQGMVPKSLERCTKLEVLNLGNNELDGSFPCWLKFLSRLRVLVLRSNKFHGNISCLIDENMWGNLQVIDIASNNFSGVLPASLFPNLKAMVANQGGTRQQLDYLLFVDTTNLFYYQDTVTLTLKGTEMEYRKIFTILTSIDFSDNHFQGSIPETVGELKSIRILNFSKNALSGHIPASLGNLKNLESLDLSSNSLRGKIPDQLAGLTFLGSLNLSYNHLVGRIPYSRQIETFPQGFTGNEGLCGIPLNNTCKESAFPQPTSSEEHETRDVGLYTSAALGLVVGLNVIFLPLVVSERWRKGYNRYANKFVLFVLRKPGKNQDW